MECWRSETAAGLLVFCLCCCLTQPSWAQFGGSPGGAGGGPGSNPFPQGGPRQESFRDKATGPVYNLGSTPVADVKILGNETVTEIAVHSYLRTKKGRSFDAEIVQSDVRRLSDSGHFRDVRTYTQKSKDGIIVTFEVIERPSIREVYFHGNRAITDKTLRKQAGIEIGDSLNMYSVDEARRKIQEYYQSQGFAKARIFVAEGDKPEHRRVILKIHEGIQQRIWSVSFIGNSYISANRLNTQIKSKPGFAKYLFGGTLDYEKIDDDIRTLTLYYRNLGFFNAKVSRELEFTEGGDWVYLNFVVHEGPRYKIRNISIDGNGIFDKEALLTQLKLKGGAMFNKAEMQRDVNSLRDIYGGNGYIFADINADTRFLETPGEVDLVYNINEGNLFRIGKINVHIQGEFPHTKRTVVLNRLSFGPGDVVDIRQVRASERRLKSSQLFENNPAQGSAPRIVIRPPDAKALASERRETFYRGQSPAGKKLIDIDVYLPAVKAADAIENWIPWR
jgi:outer membrane protein insertion porin family